MTDELHKIFKLAAYAYKHGEGTPVVIGDRIFISFPDDETGEYFEIEKWSNVIILLHCQEITQKCLDKNEKGELEYWGEVDDTEYYIKLHVPSGPGFFDEYFKSEIMAIRPYH